MGQKIHPLSVRIQSKTRYIDSAWYSSQFFSKIISVDILIRQYLNNFSKLLKFPDNRLSIFHLSKNTKLYNFFCYPKQTRETKAQIFSLSSGFSYLNKKKYTNLQNIYLYTKPAWSEKIISTNTEKFCLNLPNFLVFKNIENTLKSKIANSTLKMNFSEINPVIFKASSHEKSGMQFINSLSNFYTFFHGSKKSTAQINNLLKQFLLFSIRKKIPYFIRNNSSLVLLNNEKTRNDLKYINNLERNLANFFKSDMELIPFFANYEWQDAGYFADEIIYLLERRVSFRQLKNKILKQLMYNPNIQGVRITCSGRVGGKSKKAQRAKVDSLKYGETSLHVFSSKIDFAHRTAQTPLGSSGVKVWICYK